MDLKQETTKNLMILKDEILKELAFRYADIGILSAIKTKVDELNLSDVATKDAIKWCGIAENMKSSRQVGSALRVLGFERIKIRTGKALSYVWRK